MTAKKIALVFLFLSMLALAAGYVAILAAGSAPPWATWVVAMATAVAMVAMMVVGAARDGRPRGGLGGLALPFAFVFVVLAGGFALALWLPAAGEPLWLGLPRRAAILIYGVGILPLLVLPVAYARTFDELTLSDTDIAEVEKLRSARAEETE